MDRRHFLRNLGLMGTGALAATSPWLSTFASVEDSAHERCRIGFIGPGSRGRFLLGFMAANPKCDIVALADIYQPSLDEALKLVPKAKTYKDYRQILEEKEIVHTTDYVREAEYDLREAFSPKQFLEASLFTPYYQVFSNKFPFTPDLSILDLLFCVGPEARNYLLAYRGDAIGRDCG